MHVPLIWMASGSPVDILLVVVERVIAVHTYFSHVILLVLQRARRQLQSQLFTCLTYILDIFILAIYKGVDRFQICTI